MNSGELYTIKRGASLIQPNHDNQGFASNNHFCNLHKTNFQARVFKAYHFSCPIKLKKNNHLKDAAKKDRQFVQTGYYKKQWYSVSDLIKNKYSASRTGDKVAGNKTSSKRALNEGTA